MTLSVMMEEAKLFLFAFSFYYVFQFICGEDEFDSRDFNFNTGSIDSEASKIWKCESLDACDDKFGFEAILTLHQRLDDDANGNIDITESDEFLRDELHYSSGYERQKVFHQNDKHITVDELWLSWKTSEVHNWTVQETIQWLLTYVELPQYAQIFEEKAVDGTSLPRMAVNSMHFLSNLGIKDPIHKHKISLKAMDVVLFGPPRNHNYMKDMILILSLGIATGGCWFAFMQHKKSQSQLWKTMKDMESLQRAEESLQDLQKELDQAKLEQEMVITEKRNLERRLQDEIITVKLKHQDSSSILEVDQTKIQKLEEELKVVTEDLRCAERALQEKKWFPSPALQHWLQMTHELELRHYNEKKAAAERQLVAAKEGCEKLRKKRTSFMGAFRFAHGSSIDDVDNRILQAKTALSEVTKDLQERLNRWKQIETLCGFSIVHNPGIGHLESLLGTSMNIITPSTSVTPRLTRRSSEGTLTDDETTSIADTGISAIQHLVHNSATLFLAPLPSTHFSNIPSFDNYPSRSSPCQDGNFSLCHSGYLSYSGTDTSAPNGSLANIPFVCNQRAGLNMNFGQMRNSPSSDLKSVASSSAILQRSNAFHLDFFSDSPLNEGKDSELFDGPSDEKNASADHTHAVFTVGGSKETVLKSVPKVADIETQVLLRDVPRQAFVSIKNELESSEKESNKSAMMLSGNHPNVAGCTDSSNKNAESSVQGSKSKVS